MDLKDLTGSVFGKLTALRKVGNHKSGAALWECTCVCGNTRICQSIMLNSGHDRTCGKRPCRYESFNSEEFKRKQAIAHTGRTHSLETRLLLSQKNKGKNAGPKNGMYTGTSKEELCKAVRHSMQVREWNRTIRKRDKVCVICGSDKRLEVDHIVPLTKLVSNCQTIEQALILPQLLDLNNGRLLCRKCHKDTNTYGVKSRQCTVRM